MAQNPFSPYTFSMAAPTDPSQDDFFLPELCSGPVVIMVVLIAELTAFILTMAKHLPDEGPPLWVDLARISLFLQWIALTSTGVLCMARRYLKRMPLRYAATVSYLLLLLVTLAMSEITFQLSTNTGAGRELLPPSHAGFVLRNLIICAIVSALVLRYFYVLHQWRSNVRREAGVRFEILQARIRPHFLFNSMNTIAALIRGRPELAERQYDTEQEPLAEELAAAFAAKPLAEWLSLFDGADACVGPVATLAEAAADLGTAPPGRAAALGEHTAAWRAALAGK